MRTTIHSERLDLIPLTPAFLRAMLEHDLAGAGRILGVPVPEDLLDVTDAMNLWLKKLEVDPTLQPWLARAMVLREGGVMVGHIGFHTAPGEEYLRPYAPGGVEFGFTVFPPFLRQGFAREASKALMGWAHQVHGVTRFVLSIRPDNAASQALAAGLGFGAHRLAHRRCRWPRRRSCARQWDGLIAIRAVPPLQAPTCPAHASVPGYGAPAPESHAPDAVPGSHRRAPQPVSRQTHLSK